MTKIDYVTMTLCVTTICIGQGLFKFVGIQLRETDSILAYKVIAPALLACLIYFIATVFWIVLLKTIPLSKAYLFMALSYVLVPLISMIFFDESISLRYMLGSAMILFGIIVGVSG